MDVEKENYVHVYNRKILCINIYKINPLEKYLQSVLPHIFSINVVAYLNNLPSSFLNPKSLKYKLLREY